MAWSLINWNEFWVKLNWTMAYISKGVHDPDRILHRRVQCFTSNVWRILVTICIYRVVPKPNFTHNFPPYVSTSYIAKSIFVTLLPLRMVNSELLWWNGGENVNDLTLLVHGRVTNHVEAHHQSYLADDNNYNVSSCSSRLKLYFIKGRLRDLTVTGTPNFHKVWDFYIFTVVW